MDSKIFVGNLAFATSEAALEELFAGVGQVLTVTIVKDRDSGRSRGFGFVEMSSEAEAQAAIAQLNGRELDGRALRLDLAQPRPERRDLPARPARPDFERKRRF